MLRSARHLSSSLTPHIPSPSSSTPPARHASGKSRALGRRLRFGGAKPGVRYGGRPSTEMRYRSESALESIRSPKSVVDPIKRWRILRGDLVQATSGPLFGQRGIVLEAVRASNRVVVEGMGLVTKFVPQPDSERKVRLRTEAPIPVSRVQIVCPETNLPTRVTFAFTDDGTKVRVSKKSGCIIPRPAILRKRRVARPEEDSVKDTAPETAVERTFKDENGLYDERYGSFHELMEKTKI